MKRSKSMEISERNKLLYWTLKLDCLRWIRMSENWRKQSRMKSTDIKELKIRSDKP
jgi:hypothetical protein